jgi:flavin-dependent dehydrogenase
MEKYDIVIVGAGSSGLRLSYLLPKDLKILVLEKNDKVNIKSTGLVSYRFFKVAKELRKKQIKKELIKAVFNEAEFNFPHGSFRLRSKKKMYLLNIKNFQKILSSLAKQRNNVKISFKTKFLEKRKNLIMTSKGKVETKILVGADGPLSRVAKEMKIKLSKEIYSSLEGYVNGNFDNIIRIYFDDKYSKDFFIWIVPENSKKAKVGIITESSAKSKLEIFLKEILNNNFAKLKNFYGDVIRIGLPDKTYFNHGFLLGDAAGQIKPYSGGGFTYAAIATNIAVNTIKKAFNQNDFSEDFFKENYENRWKRELLFAIKKGYVVRKIFKIMKKNKPVLNLISLSKNLLEKTDLDLL